MIKRGGAAVLLFATLLVSACSLLGFGERPSASMSGGGAAPTEFDRYYAAGKQQLAANRVGLAIVDFERALTLDPRSVRALNALGACYDELHRYDIARGFYQQALAIEPQSADTLNNMAVSLAMAGFPTDAEYTLRQAAKLDPGNKTIQVNLVSLNGLGTARAAPQRAEIRDTPAASADASVDPRRPRIERIGVQAYMVYVGKKLPSPSAGTHRSAPLAHKAAQHTDARALQHRQTGAGAHHAKALHSKAGHRHAHVPIAHPVGLATNIKLRSRTPERAHDAHWR